jgi:P27 family predicted phage terminase small subunit
MRGRKPKPLRIQIAEGDTRKRGVNKLKELAELEPRAERGLPPCPDYLMGRARDAWFFWSEELAEMKLDHRPDGQALECLCSAYALASQAAEDLALHSMLIEEPVLNKAGELVGTRRKQNPAVQIANAAWRNVRGFCSDFGFSPAARTRIALEKPNTTEQDFMKLLSSPRLPRENRAKI